MKTTDFPARNEFDAAAVKQIIEMYAQGIGPEHIGRLFNCSNSPILRVLRTNGVHIRTKREAFAVLGEDGRAAMTSAAHAAKRGKPMKETSKLVRAATVELMGTAVASELEKRFISMLQVIRPDLPFTPQKAVGIYNVDISLTTNRVAVEIFGSGWHATGKHAARYRQRIEYLLSEAWLPLIIWVTSIYPLTQAAVDYAVALHDILGTEESIAHEEHVIWGTGEIIPVAERNPNTGARVSRSHS